MDYQLFTDVTSDLPLEYAQAHNLIILPILVTIDGTEYAVTTDDKVENALDFAWFYKRMREGAAAQTAQTTIESFLEAFRPTLQAGRDLMHIAFSSGLSGTYNSACIARDMLKAEFPERDIRIVDSLSASLGEGLLVHLAVQKKEAGASLDELEKYVQEMRYRVQHWFTVDDLMFLKRGGRVSGASAVIGTVLSIKPVLNIDDEGHLIPKEKMQGRKRALKALVDHMEANFDRAGDYDVFLSHGDSVEDCRLVEKMVWERLHKKITVFNMISPIIGCHAGPGTVALFFVSDKPRG